MAAYSIKNQIEDLEFEVKWNMELITRWQILANMLPESEKKNFYLWRIKSALEQVDLLKQNISDLKQRLNLTKCC